MKRTIAVGLVVVCGIAVAGCQPIGENDGVSKQRSIYYKPPSKKPGVIVGESTHDLTITVKYPNGSTRTWHVSGLQNALCSVGENWPSCTSPKRKPRPNRSTEA